MKNEKKSKGAIALIIILIIIILGLGGYIVYDLLNSGNTENTNIINNNTNNTVTNNTVDNGIQLSNPDLYVKGFQSIVFVENGKAYLTSINFKDESQTSGKTDVQIKEITQIQGNVVKVRGYSIYTDPTTTYFTITEEGKVYETNYYGDTIQSEYFKDYNVSDITSAKCEVGTDTLRTVEILTKDNKKVQIKVLSGEEPQEIKIEATEVN